MVKLTGPALGQHASGQLAKTLIFSNWKGTAYLKKHAKPRQPRSKAQVAMRAMMTFLSTSWEHIYVGDQDSWHVLADPAEISTFNAYQAHNLTRWRQFQTPGMDYPLCLYGSYGAFNAPYLTGLPRAIRVHICPTAIADWWGQEIHHVTADLEPIHWNDLIHVEHILQTGWQDFILEPFDPGVHWLAFARFTMMGKGPSSVVYKSTTVTD